MSSLSKGDLVYVPRGVDLYYTYNYLRSETFYRAYTYKEPSSEVFEIDRKKGIFVEVPVNLQVTGLPSKAWARQEDLVAVFTI